MLTLTARTSAKGTQLVSVHFDAVKQPRAGWEEVDRGSPHGHKLVAGGGRAH
jgi:hypothetical protein